MKADFDEFIDAPLHCQLRDERNAAVALAAIFLRLKGDLRRLRWVVTRFIL